MRDRMVTTSLEAVKDINGLCYCMRYLAYHIPNPQFIRRHTTAYVSICAFARAVKVKPLVFDRCGDA
jgi:hypothetical protein